MKRLTTAAASLMTVCLWAAAWAQTVEPTPRGAETQGPRDGTYCVEFTEPANAGTAKSLNVRLYQPDIYETAAVESMAAGDTLKINGETFHVTDVIFHEPAREDEKGIYEATVAEDYFGGIWFEWAGGGGWYGYMDDCLSSSYAGEMSVAMPWPPGLEYIRCKAAEGDETLSAEELNEALSDPDEMKGWTRYNTFMELKDGIPVCVNHRDYPLSPDPMDRPAEDE